MKRASIADYFADIVRFAFRGFVLRIDGLQIALASLLPALFRWLGWPMPDWLESTTLSYVAYVAIIFVVLRFATAPYFIWRKQVKRIAVLEHELAKPEHLQNQKLAESFADVRVQLSGALSEFGAIAERHVPRDGRPSMGGAQKPMSDAQALMQQFSDNDELIGLCRDYIQFAAIVLDKKNNRETYQDDLSELTKIGKKLFPLLRRAT